MLFPQTLFALSLAAWLVLAMASDVRTRRIPNWVVAGGMVTGLLVHALAPQGNGLFEFWWGGLGAGSALLGLAAGLGLLLPLHLLRVLGAGDVKLFAMVGTWLGAQLLLGTLLLTLLAGGGMSLAIMLARRSSRRVLGNVRLMLTTAMVGMQSGRLGAFDPAMAGSVRLPYAVAIGTGTLAHVGWLLLRAAP
jgi:prepilin peptidase CpaA